MRAEGIAFKDLRDRARKDWASQLLKQPGMSLGQIAPLMGYADQSVLTRACQRWFGRTPRQLRGGVHQLGIGSSGFSRARRDPARPQPC